MALKVLLLAASIVLAVVFVLAFATSNSCTRSIRFVHGPEVFMLRNTSADDLVIGVLTSPETVYRAIALANTWKRRSPSKVVIYGAEMSPTPPPQVPQYPWRLPTDESREVVYPEIVNLPVKAGHAHFVANETVAMLKLLYASFPHKKWYMKCDDDTFVIVSNLLMALDKRNSSEDLFLGRTISDGLLHSGGAGYVLSQSAISKLLTTIDTCLEAAPIGAGEDLIIAGCLRKYHGILPTLQMGHYFSHVHQTRTAFRDEHAEGLVQFPISFHWIQPEEMYTYDYLTFHAQVISF